MSYSSGDICAISNSVSGTQDSIGCEPASAVTAEDDVAQDDRTQPNSSTQTQQSSESSGGGGCMDIFKMIIQIAAAAVAAWNPAFAPVAMAVVKAVNSIDTGSESAASGSNFDMANIYNFHDQATNGLGGTWGAVGDFPEISPNSSIG